MTEVVSSGAAQTKRNVLLVHTMGMEQDAYLQTQDEANDFSRRYPDRHVYPNLPGRINAQAAAMLAVLNDVDTILVAGSHYWSNEKAVPTGLITAAMIYDILQHDDAMERDIIFLPNWNDNGIQQPVFDTSSELRAAAGLFSKQELNFLTSVASTIHGPSIRQFFQFILRVKANVVAAEDVIDDDFNETMPMTHMDFHYEVQTFLHSEDARHFRMREFLKRIIYMLPGGERRLRNRARTLLNIAQTDNKPVVFHTGRRI